MIGICSFGGYVPYYRLDRMTIFENMGWLNQGAATLAKGEKAVANFDEDSITMAVAAGLDCFKDADRFKTEAVYFASTTLPYKERLNAGIIAGAFGLDEQIRAADFTGGLKCSTSALLSAFEAVESGRINQAVVTAADCRLGRPGSSQEMIFGDAAAAFMIGKDDLLAEFKGSYSTTYDFVDHYRGAFAKFDRQWEDRWIRDLGYEHVIPATFDGLLKKMNVQVNDLSRVMYPCSYNAERKKLRTIMGLPKDMDQDGLIGEIGDSGAAHPLVMLARALESGQPGDKIVVMSFGSGCDAMLFELTEKVGQKSHRKGVSGYLALKALLDRYAKYLVWRDVLPADLGIRSEEDKWTRWSVNWRSRKALLGLYGSKCLACGTVQYPPQRVCVNPACSAIDNMEDFLLSDRTGRVVAYTGDNLAATNDPPAVYGTVEFDVGGRYMFDFTDCDLDNLSVGMPMEMSFRRKSYDAHRDISGYFWKAIPKKEVE